MTQASGTFPALSDGVGASKKNRKVVRAMPMKMPRKPKPMGHPQQRRIRHGMDK